MFQKNSRIEHKNGIRFYEQDIICSDYIFDGDTVIDFIIDYCVSGIGILLIKDNGKSINSADDVFLFKLGNNDFKVIEKHYLSQSTMIEASCAFCPSDINLNSNLIFSKQGKNIILNLAFYNTTTGIKELRELGHYELKNDIEKYRLGFYSNAGNILKTASIASGIPKNWIVNIKNTNGGRIAFFENGFTIEECEYDAEIEQQNIELKAGTYYIDYKQDKINDMLDIKSYVFYSNSKIMDDDKKNILENNKFTLIYDGYVNLKFKGTSGKISEISIKDFENSSFVETYDSAITQEGSYIALLLTKIKCVKWEGQINALPIYNDFTKKCPYAITATKNQRITKEQANIILNKEYAYEYIVESKKLNISCDNEINTIDIDIREEDANTLIIFQNMSAIITKLIIVTEDGNEINVLLQKTFKKYVPGIINGPILLTDTNKEPLDLSSAYREIAKSSWSIELFGQNNPIELKRRILNDDKSILVYGIPFGAIININNKDSIENFSDRYTLIKYNKYNIDYDKNTIEVNSNERNIYKYIAVFYKAIDKFSYLFTNYERELFDSASLSNIVLEKQIADISGGIMIFGIPKEALVNEKYFYKVPNNSLLRSIDLYSNKYDLISERDYSVNYTMSTIEIKKELQEQYKSFVIDYLKDNSYCINYLYDYGQYEVDICSTLDTIYMSYDIGENGAISDYKITKISPDKNKYIVLRPSEKSGEQY